MFFVGIVWFWGLTHLSGGNAPQSLIAAGATLLQVKSMVY